MRYWIFFLILILFAGCVEEKTEYIYADSDSPNYTTLTGKFQDSFCYAGAKVTAKPLDGDFHQNLIGHYISETTDNRGSYDFPVDFGSNYAEVFADIPCRSELTRAMMAPKRLSSIIDLRVDSSNNITPMTTMRSPVAKHLRSLGYSTELSLTEAERLILEYAGMPALDVRFTDMSIESDTTADSVLLAVNSALLLGRNELEQIDFMQKVSQDIIAGTEAYKSEFLQNIRDLPIIRIIANLKAMHTDLNVSLSIPPFWQVTGAPHYFDDLLGRTPVIQSSFNLEDTSSCTFESNAFNLFATPHRFKSGIELARYVALNFTGDISIWTRGFDIYDRPGTEIVAIETLNEVILQEPQVMVYNGLLGDNHGIDPSTDVYIVVRRDTNFALSSSCEGGLLPFGRKLVSNDEGVTWIGHDNNTPWFRKSGVRMFTTN